MALARAPIYWPMPRIQPQLPELPSTTSIQPPFPSISNDHHQYTRCPPAHGEEYNQHISFLKPICIKSALNVAPCLSPLAPPYPRPRPTSLSHSLFDSQHRSLLCPLDSIFVRSNMLASRTALRQAARAQLCPTSIRAASAWAKVAQGPPVR